MCTTHRPFRGITDDLESNGCADKRNEMLKKLNFFNPVRGFLYLKTGITMKIKKKHKRIRLKKLRKIEEKNRLLDPEINIKKILQLQRQFKPITKEKMHVLHSELN